MLIRITARVLVFTNTEHQELHMAAAGMIARTMKAHIIALAARLITIAMNGVAAAHPAIVQMLVLLTHR